VHLMGRGVDLLDRPGDEDLGAEPACLLERPARERLAGNTCGEPEVVLDPGGGARLTACCHALDHDGPESLGGTVDGACQPGRPGTDDHVSYSAAAGTVAMSRSSATRRSCGRATVLPLTTRTAGRSRSAGNAPDQCSASAGTSGWSHLNRIWFRS